MELYKTDIILNKNYPGIEHQSMIGFPMFEYLLKLKLIKEYEEEQSDKNGQTNTDKEIAKYQNMSKSMMPKLPSNSSVPKMNFPKIR